MTAKKWVYGFLTGLLLLLAGTALVVAVVDPFFHYHGPLSGIYYRLYDQRGQNDGITRRFDYDAVITGTSMAENFLVSEFDALYDTSSIKVCYSGATYREIADNLRVAFAARKDQPPRYVLRPLDRTLLVRDADALRDDMGEYPTYLYDSNPLNDAPYLLGREVLINYCLPELFGWMRGAQPGHTSFDEYSYNADNYAYGADVVLAGQERFVDAAQTRQLTEQERALIRENLEKNVLSLARDHPETTFLCFFPPYSMAYWGGLRRDGELDWMLACEAYAVELITACDNIELYDFSLRTDITGDLSRYHDAGHYDAAVNSEILRMMCEEQEKWRLTQGNRTEHAKRERELFHGYDYDTLWEN